MRALRKQAWFLEEERAYNRERYARERQERIARTTQARKRRRRGWKV